jgi:DinB superfamily
MEKNYNQLAVKMVLNEWDRQNAFFKRIIDSLTDEQLAKQISPGRNTGVYLLGHLVAITDSIFPLLEAGSKEYPELYETFVDKPDGSGGPVPTIADLKSKLSAVNARMEKVSAAMTTDAWFSRHTSVSAEDFQKEPHRNKLNIILNRTSHMSYHLGQLALLQKQ